MLRFLAQGVALAWVARAAPTARPTPLPTVFPTTPTARPTTAPSYQPSFTCTYELTNSNYAQSAIYACPTVMYLCPGDTVNIGKCDPTDTTACYGDQYFILSKWNPADNLYNNIVKYNDACDYKVGRYTKYLSCAVINYQVPLTDACAKYGVTLACGGTGTCGGIVPISMPGTPSAPPSALPTVAPSKKKSILDRNSFGKEAFAGEYEFIIFVIILGVFVFLVATFLLCLRFNSSFNHWFWSFEFFTKSFLGHEPVPDQGLLKEVSANKLLPSSSYYPLFSSPSS